MKLRIKLTCVFVAIAIVIGLMVFGVFAANQASVNFSGTVTFVANDVYAKVTGKITGTVETGEDIELSELNYSAMEPSEPDENLLNTWKDLNLTFLNKTSIIKIEITIENMSDERSLLVSLTGDTGIKGNVNKVLKRDGSTYSSASEIELTDTTKSGNKTTLSIEMNVYDTNYSIKGTEFSYVLSLNNPKTENEIDFFSVEYSSSNTSMTLQKSNSAPMEGNNIYELFADGDVFGYFDFSQSDITKIAKGSPLTIKFYFLIDEVEVEINGENHTLSGNDLDEYYLFTYECVVNGNISIEVVSDLDVFII